MSLGTRQETRSTRSIPPPWTGVTLGLAALALIPTAVALGRWGWTPTTGPLAFVVLVMIVIPESWVSSTHRTALEPGDRRRHQLIEALGLGLLAVGVAWVGRPVADLRPDRLLGPDIVVAAVVTFGVWVIVSQTHRDLTLLAAHGRAETGRLDPLERLLRRALLVGLLAGLAVFLADPPLGVAAVVVYATGVCAALARVRFAELERRWAVDRARVGGEVRGRFRALAGGLIAVVTLAALLLPAPVEGGARAAGGLLRSVIIWLQHRVRWFYEDFLEIQDPEQEQEVTDATERLEEEWGTPEPVGAPVDLPEPLAWADPYWAAFAWTAGALIAATIVVLYLRERPHLVRALGLSALGARLRRPRRLLRAIARLLGGVLAGVRSLLRWAAAGLRQAVDRGAGSDDAQGGRGSAATGGDRAAGAAVTLTRERARVLDAYRDVVETAATHGRGRSSGQTPYEYERRLAPVVAEHDAELRRLTETFVIARYSTLEVAPDDAEDAISAAHVLREVLGRTEEGGE